MLTLLRVHRARTKTKMKSPIATTVLTAYATRGRQQAPIARRQHHVTTLNAVWPTSARNTAGLRSSIHGSPIRGNPRIINLGGGHSGGSGRGRGREAFSDNAGSVHGGFRNGGK